MPRWMPASSAGPDGGGPGPRSPAATRSRRTCTASRAPFTASRSRRPCTSERARLATASATARAVVRVTASAWPSSAVSRVSCSAPTSSTYSLRYVSKSTFPSTSSSSPTSVSSPPLAPSSRASGTHRSIQAACASRRSRWPWRISSSAGSCPTPVRSSTAWASRYDSRNRSSPVRAYARKPACWSSMASCAVRTILVASMLSRTRGPWSWLCAIASARRDSATMDRPTVVTSCHRCMRISSPVAGCASSRCAAARRTWSPDRFASPRSSEHTGRS